MIAKVFKLFRLYSWYSNHILKLRINRWTKEDINMLNFYKQFITKNDLVYDVGANFGNRVKIFLRLGAKVIAFEPQPQCAIFLDKKFCKNKEFTLANYALGEKAGSMTMHISNISTLSTLSVDWIKNAKNSGRFKGYFWNKSIEISVSTLDLSINTYGLPKFIKIDVEGFELEVIKGLSYPISYISFEFISEAIQKSIDCIDSLNTIQEYKYNLAFGEEAQLQFADWQTKNSFIKYVSDLPNNLNGDIYAKLENC